MPKYYKNLPVKTFIADSAEAIDEQINRFRDKNVIHATLPNVVHIGDSKLKFIYTTWYTKKEEKNA